MLIKYYDYEVVEKGMTAMEQRLKTEKVRKRKLRHLMYRDLSETEAEDCKSLDVWLTDRRESLATVDFVADFQNKCHLC